MLIRRNCIFLLTRALESLERVESITVTLFYFIHSIYSRSKSPNNAFTQEQISRTIPIWSLSDLSTHYTKKGILFQT